MTLTLDLNPDVERQLSARARAKGISLADFAEEILTREAGHSGVSNLASAGNLYDLLAPVRGVLTDEEVDLYFSRTPSASRPVDFE